MLLFLWILFCFFAAYVASSKGNSGIAVFFISLFLSPLIGLLVALINKPNASYLELIKIQNGTAKRCPACAELIKPQAKICHFCGTECTNTKRVSVQ